MGIPTAVHESNAIPGVAVRMLAPLVDRVYVNFDATAKALGGEIAPKVLKVGNPISRSSRRSITTRHGKSSASPENTSTSSSPAAGSMGAEKVNFEMLDFMRDYGKDHPELLHIHASGSIEYEISKKMFHDYGLEGHENLKLVEYIFDMPEEMAAADIVVSRAGAMTLSELAVLGKCTVLIPSPHVTDNHQYKNAKVLADAGAAMLFEEKDLTDDRLTKAIAGLLQDDAKRKDMSEKIKAFALPDANREIYLDLMKLAGK